MPAVAQEKATQHLGKRPGEEARDAFGESGFEVVGLDVNLKTDRQVRGSKSFCLPVSTNKKGLRNSHAKLKQPPIRLAAGMREKLTVLFAST